MAEAQDVAGVTPIAQLGVGGGDPIHTEQRTEDGDELPGRRRDEEHEVTALAMPANARPSLGVDPRQHAVRDGPLGEVKQPIGVDTGHPRPGAAYRLTNM